MTDREEIQVWVGLETNKVVGSDLGLWRGEGPTKPDSMGSAPMRTNLDRTPLSRFILLLQQEGSRRCATPHPLNRCPRSQSRRRIRPTHTEGPSPFSSAARIRREKRREGGREESSNKGPPLPSFPLSIPPLPRIHQARSPWRDGWDGMGW
ncbi:hypothetical protein IE53DRAFT_186876 [Violaceomyces palustris]|uniref:Uncharacterized protein n=1 Tax=Violaceomyces palustris TaxID=1673888 RepID=A0ACD0NS03_9BASI|nr:hypothetical protein IE53DRAFT_186876 [Violaceomyces palustris]